MARFAELEDAEVDRLLRGDTPAGHEDLAPVAELAAAMRASATSQAPAMGPALRSQIQQRPHVPPRYAGMTRRRLQLAATAVALVVGSIAASQNALPATAQRLVSNAADVVSIDVPHPDDDDDLSPPHVEVTVTTPPRSTEPAPGNETPATPGGSGGGAVPADPSDGEGNNGDGGPPEETPGGTIPADPGPPGGGEPTTPAAPRPPSDGSGGSGGNGQGTVGGRDTAPGGQRDT